MQCAANKIHFHPLISKPPPSPTFCNPLPQKAPKTSKQSSWQRMTSRPLRDITKTPNIIEDIHTVFALGQSGHIPPSQVIQKQYESLLQPVHPIKHLVLFFCTTRQLPESDHYCSIVSITFFATIFGELETDIFMLCGVDICGIHVILFVQYKHPNTHLSSTL